MMIGLEGLPLKYILIVLVAALIIAAVVAVVTGWTGTLTRQSSQTTGTLEEGTSKQLCDMRESTGTCIAGTTSYDNSTGKWVCTRASDNTTRAC